MSKRNKAFTIIELIAVLVILSIIVLIAVPLILNIKSKAKLNAYKRSIDAYGKAVELAIANNLIDKGTIPTDLSTLKIDYTGYEVNCNVMQIKENGGVYLSECTVNGKEIKDKKTEDGWYHYNVRDLTNEEYVDMYGDALKEAITNYYNDNGIHPSSIELLSINYSGKKVQCNKILLRSDDTAYLTECLVNNSEVKDSSTEDGWYHYGENYSNEKYINMYGKSLEKSLKKYYEQYSIYPFDYSELSIDYVGKNVVCDVIINRDGTIYLKNCKVDGIDGNVDYGEDKGYAIDKLVLNSNSKIVSSYSSGNISEMYTFEHPATEQTSALTDYRYIGSSPNNYIIFNSELWRIIGIFTVEDENGGFEHRIKIMRNARLGNDKSWSTNNSSDWTQASINTTLNISYYNGLTSNAKQMIANSKYYLGGSDTKNNGAEAYYFLERGTMVYSGRSTSWYGKIGLIYPSDFLYTYALGVDDSCYTNGYNCYNGTYSVWMYSLQAKDYYSFNSWTLSPYINDSSNVFMIGVSGTVTSANASFAENHRFFASCTVFPTLYLKSSVKITSGDGSQDNPYQLSL